MLDCDSLKKHQKKHKKLSEQYTDAEKAKLEYAANPDNYDLSNVNFFPTAGNSELTRKICRCWQTFRTTSRK